jgi:hypothetical protein
MNLPLEAIVVTNEPSAEEQYRVLHSIFRRHSGLSEFKIRSLCSVLDGKLKREIHECLFYSCIRCCGLIGRLDCSETPVLYRGRRCLKIKKEDYVMRYEGRAAVINNLMAVYTNAVVT